MNDAPAKPPQPTAGPGQPAGPVHRTVPEGDTVERLVCVDCGFVNYLNPYIVVGAVCSWDDRVLLCRRSIEPRTGFWTLPAGYLELHEAPAVGAAREAAEEANATIEIDALLAVYHVTRLSQVQLIYRARLVSPAVSPGVESLAVDLFRWDDIPWDDIAFPTVRWALHQAREVAGEAVFAPRTNPQGESPDYF